MMSSGLTATASARREWALVGGSVEASGIHLRAGGLCYAPRPMVVPPWIVTCICGWLGTARTLEEAVMLIQTHKIEAMPGPRHYITLKGALGPPERDIPPDDPAPRPESTW